MRAFATPLCFGLPALGAAYGQAYPDRPIRLIVGMPNARVEL